MLIYPQAATEEDVDIRERATELGWSTEEKLLYRAKWKSDVFLKRKKACFMALTGKELAAYLRRHERAAHLDPAQPRDVLVEQLIELRLPAPRLSAKSSKSFCRRLYELMTRCVTRSTSLQTQVNHVNAQTRPHAKRK